MIGSLAAVPPMIELSSANAVEKLAVYFTSVEGKLSELPFS